MTHHAFEFGSFALHSGLVCFTHQEKRIVVHVHQRTGEVSLPRGPCRVLQRGGRYAGSIGMESFNGAAVRMASRELGHRRTIVRGYIVRALAQLEPDDGRAAADERWLMPPFVMDCGSEPVRGVAKVTAWFLAFLVGECFGEEDVGGKGGGVDGELEEGELEEGELEEGELWEGELWEGELNGGELGGEEPGGEDTRIRGPDWMVKYMTLARAAQQLPEHEAQMIQKAIAFVKIHIGT
ncbi:hypothetical protein MMC11_004969 [Xylographa trunciseda]|nr:hypothetical protein [Xylographa trunciseda]